MKYGKVTNLSESSTSLSLWRNNSQGWTAIAASLPDFGMPVLYPLNLNDGASESCTSEGKVNTRTRTLYWMHIIQSTAGRIALA